MNFNIDKSFATGAALGATSYWFACKIQRIAARRRMSFGFGFFNFFCIFAYLVPFSSNNNNNTWSPTHTYLQITAQYTKTTGPVQFIASTLGSAIFCQLFMNLQNNVKESVMRRQKQFIAERQRTYVGEARTFKDKLYEDLVRDLEQKQQQQH